MKNAIKILLCSAVVICLTSSFVFAPGSAYKVEVKEAISKDNLYGGAYLYFAGKYGGNVTKNDLKGQRELKVEGCAKGSKIISYTLDITKDGKKSSVSGKSNTLSDDAISKLQSLGAGDSFEFIEMKATLPNGKDVVDVHGQKFVVV